MRVAIILLLLLALSGLSIWVHLQASVAVEEAPAEVTKVANPKPADLVPTPDKVRVQAQIAPKGTSGTAVVVRTLDAKSRKPLPETEVLWISDSFDQHGLTDEQRDRGDPNTEVIRRQLGNRVVTDGEGRATLRTNKWLNLMACNGPLFAQRYWNVSHDSPMDATYPGEVILLLEQDQSLRARVLDSAGQPTPGVLVRLVQALAEASGETRRAHRNCGITDEEGIVVVRHLQNVLQQETESAELFGMIAAAETNHARIDPSNPPKEPIELTLPAFGTVDIALLGPDGQRWHLPRKHNIQAIVTPVDCTGGHLHRAINSVPLGTDGQATVRVACGQRMRARVRGSWAPAMTFAGPKLAGDRVAVTLRMPAKTRLVTGRVLAIDGTPFVGALQMTFDTDGNRDNVVVDRYHDGHFAFPLSPRVGDLPNIRVSERKPKGRAPLQGEAALRTPLRIGRNDLGDITLTEAPILVAGRLVFMGKAGAVDPNSISLVVQRCGKETSDWNDARELKITVDDDHRFEVRGLRNDAKYRIRVSGDCAEMAPISFEPGTADLRIEIESGSSVEATFLTDGLWHELTFRLRAEEPIEAERLIREWSEITKPTPEAGRIRTKWQNLAAGKYRLVVRPLGQAPLRKIELTVPAGTAVKDPRLRDIDLRGTLRQITVKVRAVRSRALPPNCAVILQGPLSNGVTWEGRAYSKQTPDGVKFVISKAAGVYVCGNGFRGVHMPLVLEDQTVTLAPAATVQLRWVQAQALPEGVTARLRWQPADWPSKSPHLLVREGRGANGMSAASRLIGDHLPDTLELGRAEAKMESAVPMTLHLYLHKQGEPPQYMASPLRVDPRHVSEGQTIELHTDASVVSEALRALSR